jgi:hypothetical protein
MKSSIAFLLATSALLTCAAQPGFAADVQVKVPSTPQAVQAADLIARAKHALVDYVSACSARDHAGVERAVTTDAVFEYALDGSAYLAVDAATLVGDCWATVPTLDQGERVSTLWIFPTNDPNAVFVHYYTSAAGSKSTTTSNEHLALVEMRGDRILRMHDFTAAPPAMVASAGQKAAPSEPSTVRVTSSGSGS